MHPTLTLPALMRQIATDRAHLMSVARLPLAAAVWFMPEAPWFVVTVLALAAITDGLDGWLGRRTHTGLIGTANIGSWLDPICDKVFIASAALAVVVTWRVPLPVLALLLVRDVATLALAIVFRVVGGRAIFHAHDFRARLSGKLTTGLQGGALAAVLFTPPEHQPSLVWAFAVSTAAVGTVAVIERVVAALRDRRRRAKP